MPTPEKQAPPKPLERPEFKHFMHEWEEKLHHTLETDSGHEDVDRPEDDPQHHKAA